MCVRACGGGGGGEGMGTRAHLKEVEIKAVGWIQ